MRSVTRRSLILNGGHRLGDDSDIAAHAIAAECRAHGFENEEVVLREERFAHCVGCFHCWSTTPGLCRAQDAGNEVARMYVNSDLVVMISPVVFGGYSSVMKACLDKLICTISPFFTTVAGETHHRRRYPRYPRLLTVGLLQEPDEDAAHVFRRLVARNALNLHPEAVQVLVHTSPGNLRSALLTAIAALEEDAA